MPLTPARLLAVLLLSLTATGAAAADEAPKEPAPPYFASMRFAETNMRVGPGKDYPISWVYHRKSLPVRVIDSHQEWRNVVDPYGDKGWVARSQINLARSAITIPKSTLLRANPSEESGSLARIEGGVVSKILSCAGDWCQLELATHRGWMKRNELWGVSKEEIIGTDN